MTTSPFTRTSAFELRRNGRPVTPRPSSTARPGRAPRPARFADREAAEAFAPVWGADEVVEVTL